MSPMVRLVGLSLFITVVSAYAQNSAPPVNDPATGFGGQAPLGPDDQRRHAFRPYSAIKLNTLGGNYCENLLDDRLNITSYTHQGFNSNRWDAWHLQFPDDAARIVEGLVWEDRYSGMARLETVRRITKGLLAAHIPGTQAYHFFRHRSAGKTYLIFDDSAGKNEGRLLLSTWGDEVQGDVCVGFQARFGEKLLEQKDFQYADIPEKAGTPGLARDPRYWNASPFRFTRNFRNADHTVQFTGQYGLSDEDLPLSFAYEAAQADEIAITIGEPGKPIPLLWDAHTPGIIDFPDRATQWKSDKDGDQIMKKPPFHYLILRKRATWACPGYSSALIVFWDGQPDAVEALAENGYGQIRIHFANTGDAAKGCVRLYPFRWLNEDDMEHLFRNAESFLARGRLLQNGFPSQQMVNAIPSGLAAGALLLAKYRDPFAETARIEAVNAVNAFLDPENKGRTFARLFLEVKAAAWMTLLGKECGDSAMTDTYAAWTRRLTDRMISPEGAFDGKAWPDGWTHFNNMKALWLAYEATGESAYRTVYERTLEAYTIDAKGVYRFGEPLKAPGGFEVYAGALPIAVWGHWGMKDRVEQLIHLQVPNGWHNPDIPVADLWNDAGAGPWSQDDANPDMLGYLLRGYALPTEPKYLLPTGAFPVMQENGALEPTWAPIVNNPYFRPESRDIQKLENGQRPQTPTFKTIAIDLAGQQAAAPRITQTLTAVDARGAALDIRMARGYYQVEVSPDGQQWMPRLDTWCDTPTTRSMDCSFLVGGMDELVRVLEITPPDDAPWLQSATGTEIAREHARSIGPEGAAVYKIALPRANRCRLEFLVANNYRIDLSANGEQWTETLTPQQICPAKDDSQKDAGWLRMADATPYLTPEGVFFVRIRNGGNTAAFDGAPAFLRRMAVYASYDSPEIHVRIQGAPFAQTPRFNAEWIRARLW